MRRHEVTDEQWELVAELMPRGSSRGGGRGRDHRQVLGGLFWRRCTGARWRDLPGRYGPWRTVHARPSRAGGGTAPSTASWTGCGSGWTRKG